MNAPLLRLRHIQHRNTYNGQHKPFFCYRFVIRYEKVRECDDEIDILDIEIRLDRSTI